MATDPTFLAQLAANGLSVGMGYALAAVGLALLFGILGQVNFAHGELYMLAAFVLFWLTQTVGLPYAGAVVVAVVLMAAAGALLAQTVILPNLERGFESVILGTLAVAIILQNAVRLTFGATPLDVASPLESVTFELGGVLFFGQRVLVGGAFLLAFAALTALLRCTEIGRAMRAMAQNREACLMVGIDARRVTRWTGALAAALTGLAGVVIAPLFDLYPNMGTEVVFKSFAVVIIGGMGNVWGSALAGIALGVAESYAGGLGSAGLRDAIAFTLMIAMLLVRPQGLFGRSVRV
ncbi:MAG TPA: branched-chain amino acid ABC transporter permease [Gammaproteobacteria bacterium]|nr:branched-chain amino acid ABC transporter permease [Gammaproteobacteria bacterium]